MEKLAHKNEYRTHTCGELRLQNAGENVVLSGWVDTIRKLGSLTFMVLRDHYGETQVIVKNEDDIKDICPETVVKVTGKCLERYSKNPKMPTGDIEVEMEKLEILGTCESVLPFQIANAPQTKEDLRLTYRYLDLRNPENHKRIQIRAELLHQVRDMMYNLGFTEVQTPILTSSSPEGARDFLVPSRLNKGKFYALPQSPQQFKQLLMISGFDKYYQIAPCFRDEDARADRSPGEFYQMDMEMSFATQEDVFKVIEKVLYNIFKNNSSAEITPAPFERIKFNDSMEKYCTDKPDLRNPLICNDLTKILENTEFNAFKNKTIKCICAPTGEKPRRFYDDLSKFIVDLEGKGLAYLKVENDELTGSIVKFLNQNELAQIKEITKAKNGDSIFIIADDKIKATKLIGTLRNELGARLNLIDNNKFHFVWIVDFPFYEWNEDTKAVEFAHNPFSMPQGGLDSLLNKKPLDILAYQYDLVLNGVELLSGAVRNHEPKIMEKAFEIAGYSREIVQSKFPALYNAFRYGAPPHAGAAFGFDRVVMFLCNSTMIRDVIAFPFNKQAQDLMMGAPNEVFPKQLEDVAIKTVEPKKEQ